MQILLEKADIRNDVGESVVQNLRCGGSLGVLSVGIAACGDNSEHFERVGDVIGADGDRQVLFGADDVEDVEKKRTDRAEVGVVSGGELQTAKEKSVFCGRYPLNSSRSS